ncbi:VCBS domain-containing protein [Aphanothece hegewaldii]|nr:VCBS domain-containing protein [Aphanothece hegewaldii]
MTFIERTETSNPFHTIDVGLLSTPTFADIDSDGDLDAVVGEGDGNLNYYLNTGTALAPVYTEQTGTSNPFHTIDVGFWSTPTFADIDSDGDLDAVVGESNGTLKYYLNTGTALAPFYTEQTGTSNPFNDIYVGSFIAPTLADIDSDGDLDAVVGALDGTLKYYLNTGTALAPFYTEQTGTSNPFNGIYVGSLSKPTLADLDGDGDLDAVVGELYGRLLYYKNTGTALAPVYRGQTGTSNPFNTIDVGSFSTPTFADIDSDGDLDAVVGEIDGNLNYFENIPTPKPVNFTQPPTSPFNGIYVGLSSAPTLADIDGDGDLDAVVGEYDGNLNYYKNTGTALAPVYTEQTGTSNPFNDIYVGLSSAPTLADIDGDGDLDAVVGEKYGTLKYYLNTGTALAPVYREQTGTSNPFNDINVGNYSTPTFADIDSDGDLDAVVGASDGTLKYYKNTGTALAPVYREQTGTSNPFNDINVGYFNKPTLADIDSDGDLDAVVGELYGRLLYYKNTGTALAPVYREQTGTSNPFNGIDVVNYSKPTFADIDSDGDLDAVVGAGGGTLKYYLNNQVPVAVNDSATTNEDTAVTTGDVLLNDSEPDGESLSITQVNGTAITVGSPRTLPSGALLTLNANNTFTFNPNGQYNSMTAGLVSNPSFTYTISDGKGGTATATVTMTINGVNDVATITGTLSTSVTEYTTNPNLTATGTLTVTDPDTGENQFSTTVVPVGSPLGSLSITSAGAYTYTVVNSAVQYLGAGITKTETFTVKSIDGTATQNITVSITGVNDVATIAGTLSTSVTEDTTNPNLTATGSLTISDPDTGENQFSTTVVPVGSPLGSLSITSAGSYTYTVVNSAVQYLGAGGTKTETFTVSSVDGTTQNITVTINGVNDVATITGTSSASVTEDDSDPNLTATGTLTVTDPDTGENQFSTTVVPVGSPLGSLSITSAGSYTYTVVNSAVQYLNTGETKTETFTVSSIDGTTQDITITINGLDDNLSPVALDNTATAVVNFPINISVSTLLSNDTDADGDVLSITSISNITGGTATLNDNGTLLDKTDDFITYNPTSVGNFSLDYTVDDGNGGTDIGTVQITVSRELLGTNWADTLSGGAGDDIIKGLAGKDLVYGNSGNDRIEGGRGNDTIEGGDDDDFIQAGDGDDLLFGNGGNDTIYGGNGQDTSYGGDGDDFLFGQLGNNILVGGGGSDTLYGGSQVNQFVYQEMSDRGTAITGDKIYQFDHTQAQLILTELLDNIGYSGSNPVADGYLRLFQSGNSTLLQIDADGGANSFVRMATLYNTTATNFIIGTNVII